MNNKTYTYQTGMKQPSFSWQNDDVTVRAVVKWQTVTVTSLITFTCLILISKNPLVTDEINYPVPELG
jgi:hypothetical protein